MVASSSGGIRPLYGVIIRDKCKSADAATLKAYRIVAEDLLKDLDPGHADAKGLKEALQELEHALHKK